MKEPNASQIDIVLRHLPILNKPGFVPSIRHPMVERKGGITAGWEEHSNEVRQLIADLYEGGFVIDFDWGAWNETARQFVDVPERLENATMMDLIKLLTTHVRADRFFEGHFTSMIECGQIAAILRRLEQLRSTLD